MADCDAICDLLTSIAKIVASETTALKLFECDVTASRHVTIKVDKDAVTIEGSNDGNGVAKWAQLTRLFLWETSGARSLHLQLDDGRSIGIATLAQRSTDPDVGKWETFHAAVAAILYEVSRAREDLKVELGPSPKSRNLMATIVAVLMVVAIATALLVYPPGQSEIKNYLPLAGLLIPGGMFVWAYWLRSVARMSPAVLSAHVAAVPKSLLPTAP